MTRKLSTQGDFPVPPDAMFRIMTDPNLLERQHRQQGAVQVQVRDRERDGRQLIQEVVLREYWRDMKGVDRSRVEDAITVYTWDLSDYSCTWSYRGARGDLVRIGGEIRIQAMADGCRVNSDVTVRVPVPLLGRVLEKRIGREIEDGFPPFEELLREFCRHV